MSHHATLVDEKNRYLIFNLGGELYGTPLLGVREVAEYVSPKTIPNTVPHFKGVINIRGEIVPVLDLRTRLGYPAERHGDRPVLLVFETDSGPIAGTVDRVEQVADFEPETLDASENIRARIPLDYFVGLAHLKDQLVTVVALEKLLGKEDLVKVAGSRPDAA